MDWLLDWSSLCRIKQYSLILNLNMCVSIGHMQKKNEERKRRKKNEIKINRLWYLTSMLNCSLLFYGLCKKVQRIWIILLSFDSFICMNFFCCFIIIIVYEQKKKRKVFLLAWVWVCVSAHKFCKFSTKRARKRERGR